MDEPPVVSRDVGQRRGSPRGAHPCLPPDVAHQKAHRCPSPNATSALLVHSAPTRRGALKPLSEHVASEKRANGQRRGSPRGAHPCLPPDVAHQKAYGCPSPHATSALLVHSAPSRLVEGPSSP